MDRYAELKKKLKERRDVTMANLMVTDSPLLMEAFSAMDCILLDKEHGIVGTEELIPLTLQCRHLGIPTIVRVEDSLYHLIAKSIDLGADGIMLPRVESMAQMKIAVEAMNFPPLGRTGCGGFGLFREGEDFETFQKNRIFLPQIESAKGRELIPEMVEAYGDYIDGFIIGPFDYSISMGIPAQIDHPALVEEIGKVFDTCSRLGKSCGCFGADADHAKLYRDMGANIFWIGNDLTYIRTGIEKMLGDIFGKSCV